MFELFTEQARMVLVLAQQEERVLNHNVIGTQHILLGLLHDDRVLPTSAAGAHDVAGEALQSIGLNLEDVRSYVHGVVPPTRKIGSGSMPFTASAKMLLQLSQRESRRLGHDYVGTEHLLLALLDIGEHDAGDLAARAITALGVDLSAVRQTVLEMTHVEDPESFGALDLPARDEPPPERGVPPWPRWRIALRHLLHLGRRSG